jgi:hypothetical protein
MGDGLSMKRAQPRFRFALPGYPTAVAGLVLGLCAGCGSGQSSEDPGPPSAGKIAALYDAAPPSDADTVTMPSGSAPSSYASSNLTATKNNK